MSGLSIPAVLATLAGQRPVFHSEADLRHTLARQTEQMERLSDPYEDHGLVLATEKGPLTNLTNLRTRSFAPLLERAGFATIRFHDLRHTCATLRLSRDVNPKIVSEMLG